MTTDNYDDDIQLVPIQNTEPSSDATEPLRSSFQEQEMTSFDDMLFATPDDPYAVTNRNRGLPASAETTFSALNTKQDRIWVDDPSGQWTLDFDYYQPNVRIESIDYIEGSWKAKGEYNGAECVWSGPQDETATIGQFTNPNSVVPTFTASRIIPLPARATQSDTTSANEKRIATMSAVRKAIEHGVTNSLTLVPDSENQPTAVTIGSRADGSVGSGSLVNGSECNATNSCAHAEGHGCSATGKYAHAEGSSCTAQGDYSHAEGHRSSSLGAYSFAGGDSTHANGPYSFAIGHLARTGNNSTTHRLAFAWNGDDSIGTYFCSHGNGTFNINPKNGILGFYIGEQNLQEIIDARIQHLLARSSSSTTA